MANKQVQMRSKENLYFTVLEFIKTYHRLPKHLGSKTKINYYVQRLKREGIILKKGYGVWEVIGVPKQVQMRYRYIRGHGLGFTIKLPNNLSNWHNREEYLVKNKITYHKLKYGVRIKLKDQKIWLMNRKIVIYLNKSFYAETPEDSQKYAIYDLGQLCISLGNLLNIDLSKPTFKIFRQHYAWIKNALAEQCNRNNEKVYCYYNQEGWLVIDNSKGLNELETIHPKTAVTDHSGVIIPIFNDYKDLKERTGEILLPSQTLEMINELSKAIEQQQELINSLIYKPEEKLKPRDSYFG